MSAFDLLSYDAEKDKLVFGGHVFVFGESQSQRKFVGALLEAKGRPMPAHEIAGHISQHCDMHQIPRIFQNVLNEFRSGHVTPLSFEMDRYFSVDGQGRIRLHASKQEALPSEVRKLFKGCLNNQAIPDKNINTPDQFEPELPELSKTHETVLRGLPADGCLWDYDEAQDCLTFCGEEIRLNKGDQHDLLIKVVQDTRQYGFCTLANVALDMLNQDDPETLREISVLYDRAHDSLKRLDLEFKNDAGEVRSPKGFLRRTGNVVSALSEQQISERVQSAVGQDRSEWTYDARNNIVLFNDVVLSVENPRGHVGSLRHNILRHLVCAFPDSVSKAELVEKLKKDGIKVSDKDVLVASNTLARDYTRMYGFAENPVCYSQATERFCLHIDPSHLKGALESQLGVKRFKAEDVALIIYENQGRAFIGTKNEDGEWDYKAMGPEPTVWRLMLSVTKKPDQLQPREEISIDVFGSVQKRLNQDVQSLKNMMNRANPSANAGDRMIHLHPRQGVVFRSDAKHPLTVLSDELKEEAEKRGITFPDKKRYGKLTLDFNDVSVSYDGQKKEMAQPYLKTLFFLSLLDGDYSSLEALSAFHDADDPLSKSALHKHTAFLREEFDIWEPDLSRLISSKHSHGYAFAPTDGPA